MSPSQGLPELQTPLEEPEEGGLEAAEDTGAAGAAGVGVGVVSAAGVYTGATSTGASEVELGVGAASTGATEVVGGTYVETGAGAT